MSTKYVKSLIAVMLLASALAGCATGGSTNTSAFPAATVGEAEG